MIRSLWVRFVDWVFRRHTPPALLLQAGVALLLASSIGFVLKIDIPGWLNIGLDTSGVSYITTAGAVVGVGLVIIATLWLTSDRLRAARKRILVVELRGLRDTSDTPLVNALSSEFEGRRDEVLVDLRQGISDGTIVAPETALQRVLLLSNMLATRRAGTDRQDITTVFGGLAPVPFTFLAGMLIDDESAIHQFDWDRQTEKWRQLDGQDDGDRFKLDGLESVPEGAPNVVLAASMSYKADFNAIARAFPGWPVAHLSLANLSVSSHWSEIKQSALAQSFLDALIRLNNQGAQRVHLVLAGPSSLVFRLGRAYDKRNLPSAIVYQYERTHPTPYPWGIELPTHGNAARIVKSAE